MNNGGDSNGELKNASFIRLAIVVVLDLNGLLLSDLTKETSSTTDDLPGAKRRRQKDIVRRLQTT